MDPAIITSKKEKAKEKKDLCFYGHDNNICPILAKKRVSDEVTLSQVASTIAEKITDTEVKSFGFCYELNGYPVLSHWVNKETFVSNQGKYAPILAEYKRTEFAILFPHDDHVYLCAYRGTRGPGWTSEELVRAFNQSVEEVLHRTKNK
jgi:hypothetical protein